MYYDYEKKTIKRSLFVLFMSFLLIYILLFHIKWDEIKDKLQFKWTWEIERIIVTETVIDNQEKEIINKSNNKTWQNTNSESQNILYNTWSSYLTWNYNIQTDSWNNKTNNLDNQTNINILSWTKLYNWPVESIEKLWITPDYVLKDEKDIYYISISKEYDRSEIVRELWWNLYILNTEQEILQNKLFWNKITFINIPEYKNKNVLILMEINKENRLIQISYSIYYESKQYLQKIFSK